MTPFASIIISIYGEKGKKWFDGLAELVEQIASRLDLRGLEPVPNLSYNYVLSGFQGNNPIILKLGLDRRGGPQVLDSLAAKLSYSRSSLSCQSVI